MQEIAAAPTGAGDFPSNAAVEAAEEQEKDASAAAAEKEKDAAASAAAAEGEKDVAAAAAAEGEKEEGAPPLVALPQVGDLVILYGSRETLFLCRLTSRGVCRTRLGDFAHADILKTPFGHKVFATRNGKWLVVLRPTPYLHTLALRHRTQIIYHADIALILSLLDVRSGKVIIEAGTGSGSLSYALAAALRPHGHLFTFEFHRQRWMEAKSADRNLHAAAAATAAATAAAATTATAAATAATAAAEACRLLDVCLTADGVFLDLPSPWLAVPHAFRALKGGGRLVTFSPCIEQLQKTLSAAEALRFQDFQAFEILAKPWGVCISRPIDPLEKQAKRGKRKKCDSSSSPLDGEYQQEKEQEEEQAEEQQEEDEEEEEEEEGEEEDDDDDGEGEGEVELEGEGEGEVEGKGKGEGGSQQAGDSEATDEGHLEGSFPSLLSHFLGQPLPAYLSGGPPAAAAAAAAGKAAAAEAAAAEVSLGCVEPVSSYHYQLPMRGHTGYVACCIKPSEDELLQPLP
ncbi:hypothetical protein Efla_006419 [Eimeria flavescens]